MKERMRMKAKISFVCFVGFALGFWSYSGGRTLCETVGFDARTFAFGLLTGVGLPLFIILPVLILKPMWSRKKTGPASWLIALLVANLLIGSLISEWWILRDETRFAEEVSKADGQNLYSRARAWPNQSCSLVFVPGKGIHATD
jgi:hypothetical protein